MRLPNVCDFPSPTTPLAQGRQRICFDTDWRFHLGESDHAVSVDFDDGPWRHLHLPHDWSIEGKYRAENPAGACCGFLPTGIGWYRKCFEVPADLADRRVQLELDGVMGGSDVYVNAKHVGGRVNGCLPVICDLTPHLHRGRNVLAVRVDNAPQPAARWYTGSGIYRHAWLTMTGPVHVPFSGVFVRCTSASPQRAELTADIQLRNAADSAEKVTVTVRLRDPDGSLRDERHVTVCVGGDVTEQLTEQFSVSAPKLWSDRLPNLYRLEVSVTDPAGRLLDKFDTSCGIRWMWWDAEEGFFLNDQPLKLRGVCNHEDLGPLGVALNDKVLEGRLRQLKAMGCNAVRTSHHPFSPTFYDLCDRLGMLVLNECFDGWHAKADADYGARFFVDHWRTDVADWVRRDRNHPCVILWSIGNETGLEDVHGIRNVIRRLDPTRCVTGGEVHETVDVSGWNGYAGQPQFPNTWRRRIPLVLTEVPHTFQTRGFYRTHTGWRDRGNPRHELAHLTEKELFTDDFAAEHPHTVTYNSSYDNSGVRISARRSWQRTRDHAWISGEFRWSGHDYLGESYGWPLRMGNFGVIDLCNFPKDHYYFYQSQWTDAPMVHLLPHWTHPTLPAGTPIPVWAYSNCDEVELFANGRSLGVRRPGRSWDEMACQWMVPWQSGELKAIGRRNGHRVAETMVRTADVPTIIGLNSDTAQLRADVTDLAQVTVTLTDQQGTPVPYGDSRVFFAVQGPSRLRAVGNGDPADLDPHSVPNRRAFQGLCKAFVEPTGSADAVIFWAAAILGDRSVILGDRFHIDVQRLALRGPATRDPFEIRYCLNGRDPVHHGLRYAGPVHIERGTRVRAVVLSRGRRVLELAESFDKTTPVLRAVRRVEAQPDLPRCPQLVGQWFNPADSNSTIRLCEDGSTILTHHHRSEFVGTWWYAPPVDVFEDASLGDDHGQLNWFGQEPERLRLLSSESLRLMCQAGQRVLQRKPD